MGTHQEERGGEEGVYEGEEVHGAAEAEETCYEGDDDAAGMIRRVIGRRQCGGTYPTNLYPS